MTKKPSRWSIGFTVAVLLGVALGCGIREDEYSCEDAVSHLKECCPGFFEENVSCTYTAAQGCGDMTVYPDFSVSESNCIRSQSCAALVGNHVCDRALKLTPTGGTTTDRGVCP